MVLTRYALKSIWLKGKTSCTIYRPPYTNVDLFLDEFDRMLHKVNLENKDVYLMGDFNIDLLQEDKFS